MPAVVITPVAFGDNEFAVVRNPGGVVSWGEERTFLPDYFLRVGSAEVGNSNGGDIGFWYCNARMDAVERITKAEKIVENRHGPRLCGEKRSNRSRRKKFFYKVNRVVVSTFDETVTV